MPAVIRTRLPSVRGVRDKPIPNRRLTETDQKLSLSLLPCCATVYMSEADWGRRIYFVDFHFLMGRQNVRAAAAQRRMCVGGWCRRSIVGVRTGKSGWHILCRFALQVLCFA